MKKYVLGFMFSKDKERVALIKKTKPAWQAGRLNGIGGKVEEFDLNIRNAMSREFLEETDVKTNPNDWTWFASMINSQFIVYTFVAYGDIDNVKTTTEEVVTTVQVDDIVKLPQIGRPTISNLSWLIPMALNSEHFQPVEIFYHEEDKYIEDGNR